MEKDIIRFLKASLTDLKLAFIRLPFAGVLFKFTDSLLIFKRVIRTH
jgi:hypothetical protein